MPQPSPSCQAVTPCTEEMYGENSARKNVLCFREEAIYSKQGEKVEDFFTVHKAEKVSEE